MKRKTSNTEDVADSLSRICTCCDEIASGADSFSLNAVDLKLFARRTREQASRALNQIDRLGH